MAWTENQMNPLHRMIFDKLKESPATMREIIDYCISKLTTTPGVSAAVTINHVHQLWGAGVLGRERVDGECKDIYKFITNNPDGIGKAYLIEQTVPRDWEPRLDYKIVIGVCSTPQSAAWAVEKLKIKYPNIEFSIREVEDLDVALDL